MARTLQAIFDEIETTKNSYSALSGLTSTSQTAIYKLWMWIVAFAIWTHEKLWDVAKIDLQALADSAIAGTFQWYASQVQTYQHGGTVEVNDNGQIEWITDSPTLVEKVSVSEFGGVLVIKVAKLNTGTNELEKLSASELSGLLSFVKKFKFAGTPTIVESNDPDLLKLEMDVYYDPQADQAGVETAVEAAINQYLLDIPFDGKLYETKLVDAIQAVTGVVDVDLTNLEAAVGANTYTIDRVYQFSAGYAKIDPAYPLSGTITYVAAS